MNGYKRFICIITVIATVLSILQVSAFGKSSIMMENSESLVVNDVSDESEINNNQIDKEAIQVDEQVEGIEDTVGVTEASLLDADENTEPFDDMELEELSDAGTPQTAEDIQVAFENEEVDTYNSEDVIAPSSDELETIEAPELIETTVGQSIDEESGIEENEDQGNETEEEKDNIDALMDPGFLVTNVLFGWKYSDGHFYTYYDQPQSEVTTSDGIYHGRRIKNMYQTIITDAPIGNPGNSLTLSDSIAIEYEVADDERVHAFIGREELRNGTMVDFSTGEVKVTVEIDESDVIEYTIRIEVQPKLESWGYKLQGHSNSEAEVYFYKDNVDNIDPTYIYNSYKIRNVDYKEVTGLTVKLINAKNIKISEDSEIEEGKLYTLTPGELKQVLFAPTGEGEISGELVVSCDQQEDLVVKLSGESEWYSSADKVEKLVKYVVYSFLVDKDQNGGTYRVEGKLPEGMIFDADRREIYGCPLKEGQYDFSVINEMGGESKTTTYTMLVLTNDDLNVRMETHTDGFAGFDFSDSNLWEVFDKWERALKVTDRDVLFISEGLYKYYVKVWLNGEELVEDIDFTAESGSTRITLLSQTIKSKCKTITQEEGEKFSYATEQANTLCVEFNIHPNKTIRGEEYLRRTCQDFWVINNEEEREVDSRDYTTTIDVSVADGSGNAMSDYVVELHSEVQTAKTDASGNVQFASVEMGSHALYVKNNDGSVVAERHFTLVPGEQTSYDGDTITVARGDSVKLTMTVASEQKTKQNTVTRTTNSSTTNSSKATGTPKPTITSAVKNTKSNNAKTGDNNNIFIYMILMVVAASVLGFACRKSSR